MSNQQNSPARNKEMKYYVRMHRQIDSYLQKTIMYGRESLTVSGKFKAAMEIEMHGMLEKLIWILIICVLLGSCPVHVRFIN